LLPPDRRTYDGCKESIDRRRGGNFDKAEELLRVKLRATKAGRNGVPHHGGRDCCCPLTETDAGALVEINCETDFVTRATAFLPLQRKAVAEGIVYLVS
jgi:elongation factor Ts